MDLRIRNVDDKLHKKLMIIAVHEKKSLNALVIEALEDYATKHGKSVSNSVGMLFQDMPPLKDEE